jgi:hypothetical protein
MKNYVQYFAFALKEMFFVVFIGVTLSSLGFFASLIREKVRDDLLNNPMDFLYLWFFAISFLSILLVLVMGIPATIIRIITIRRVCRENGIRSIKLAQMSRVEREEIGFQRM